MLVNLDPKIGRVIAVMCVRQLVHDNVLDDAGREENDLPMEEHASVGPERRPAEAKILHFYLFDLNAHEVCLLSHLPLEPLLRLPRVPGYKHLSPTMYGTPAQAKAAVLKVQVYQLSIGQSQSVALPEIQEALAIDELLDLGALL